MVCLNRVRKEVRGSFDYTILESASPIFLIFKEFAAGGRFT
jgi:hypothetical protein